MQAKAVAEIGRRLRTDEALRELCRRALRSDQWDNVVTELRRSNIAAERDDLAYALAYQWVLGDGPSGDVPHSSNGAAPPADRAGPAPVPGPTLDRAGVVVFGVGTLLATGSAGLGVARGINLGVVLAAAVGVALVICALVLKITRDRERRSVFKRLDQELQDGLIGVVRQIDRGYARTMLMYTISFYIGVGLVVGSAILSVWRQADSSVLLFGGLGLADILTQLIFKPAQDVQDSRANLAQLQAAFFNWINDIYNWNRYLGLIQDVADKNGQIPELDEVSKVSALMLTNTGAMLDLVARYCEHFAGGTKFRPGSRPNGA